MKQVKRRLAIIYLSLFPIKLPVVLKNIFELLMVDGCKSEGWMMKGFERRLKFLISIKQIQNI